MVKGQRATEELDAVCFPCPRGKGPGGQRATLGGTGSEGVVVAATGTLLYTINLFAISILWEHGEGGFTYNCKLVH